jgi:hypothetical protein
MEKDKLNWLLAPLFLAIPFLLAFLGQLLAGPMPNAWYDQLNKPSFNPPAWLFGPVWTLLYISMGLAAWLVWRDRKNHQVAFPLASVLRFAESWFGACCDNRVMAGDSYYDYSILPRFTVSRLVDDTLSWLGKLRNGVELVPLAFE